MDDIFVVVVPEELTVEFVINVTDTGTLIIAVEDATTSVLMIANDVIVDLITLRVELIEKVMHIVVALRLVVALLVCIMLVLVGLTAGIFLIEVA